MTNTSPGQGQCKDATDISAGTAETKVGQERISPNVFFTSPLSGALILHPKLCPITDRPRFGKHLAYHQESCISTSSDPRPQL